LVFIKGSGECGALWGPRKPLWRQRKGFQGELTALASSDLRSTLGKQSLIPGLGSVYLHTYENILVQNTGKLEGERNEVKPL
jgi:hypothetical protein